jgi:hypothetical protein
MSSLNFSESQPVSRQRLFAAFVLLATACGGIAIADVPENQPGALCNRCDGVAPATSKACPGNLVLSPVCLVNRDGTCGYGFAECPSVSSGVVPGQPVPPAGQPCSSCAGPVADDARLCPDGTAQGRQCLTNGMGGCGYAFPACPAGASSGFASSSGVASSSGAGSSSSSSGGSSSSSSGQMPPTTVQIVCDAEISANQKCRDGNQSGTCRPSTECVAKFMTEAGARAFAQCRQAPRCGGENRCFNEAGSASPDARAFQQECFSKVRSCGRAIRPDVCDTVVLAFNVAPAARKCLTLPCEQVQRCYENSLQVLDACGSNP